MKIPKVFISYSHDSLIHKKWVLDMAIRLRNNGIDAVIDQWELKPGDDLPHFMETNLANSDFVIMICTERYVKKANQGTGGVGYEKMIITSNLLSGIDQNKVIPIIRQSGEYSVPTFLKSKLFVNFSKNDDFEYSFDELIRAIHHSPLFKKPKIGNNPFKQISSNEELKSHDGLLELMRLIVQMFEMNTDDYINYRSLFINMGISRIMLDIMIKQAVEIGYLSQDNDKDIRLKDKGKHYAVENKLI